MATVNTANPNSVITTILRRIRFYLEEASTGKYTDNDLLDLVIPPALQEVWNYVNAAADNPIVASFPFSTVANQASYEIPPSIQNVWQIVSVNDQGRVTGELIPLGRHDFRGPGWTVEGNMLTFDPIPTIAKDYLVRFTPVHDQPMHVGVGTLASDLETFTLGTTPSVGFLDKRVNGLIGGAVRILGDNIVETRIIATYDPYDSTAAAPQLTVRPAFDRTAAASGLSYEIFPLGSAAFIESVALGASLKLAAVRSLASTRVRSLWDQYRHARRTEAMRLANMMGRRPKTIERLTGDNPDIGLQSMFGNFVVNN